MDSEGTHILGHAATRQQGVVSGITVARAATTVKESYEEVKSCWGRGEKRFGGVMSCGTFSAGRFLVDRTSTSLSVQSIT